MESVSSLLFKAEAAQRRTIDIPVRLPSKSPQKQYSLCISGCDLFFYSGSNDVELLFENVTHYELLTEQLSVKAFNISGSSVLFTVMDIKTLGIVSTKLASNLSACKQIGYSKEKNIDVNRSQQSVVIFSFKLIKFEWKPIILQIKFPKFNVHEFIIENTDEITCSNSIQTPKLQIFYENQYLALFTDTQSQPTFYMTNESKETLELKLVHISIAKPHTGLISIIEAKILKERNRFNVEKLEIQLLSLFHQSNLTSDDVWMGSDAFLKFITKNYQILRAWSLGLVETDSYENGFLSIQITQGEITINKKIKAKSSTSLKELLESICTKFNLSIDKYSLKTLANSIFEYKMEDERKFILGEFGFGLLFKHWCLVLVVRSDYAQIINFQLCPQIPSKIISKRLKITTDLSLKEIKGMVLNKFNLPSFLRIRLLSLENCSPFLGRQSKIRVNGTVLVTLWSFEYCQKRVAIRNGFISKAVSISLQRMKESKQSISENSTKQIELVEVNNVLATIQSNEMKNLFDEIQLNKSHRESLLQTTSNNEEQSGGDDDTVTKLTHLSTRIQKDSLTKEERMILKDELRKLLYELEDVNSKEFINENVEISNCVNSNNGYLTPKLNLNSNQLLLQNIREFDAKILKSPNISPFNNTLTHQQPKSSFCNPILESLRDRFKAIHCGGDDND